MKCLGIITDFHYIEQRGFVVLDHYKIPFDKSLCSSDIKRLGDNYVKLITYEPSPTSRFGWRVVKLEEVDENLAYIKSNFFNFGNEERASAIFLCRGVIREIVNELIDYKVIETVAKSVHQYLEAFSIDAVIASVTGRVASGLSRRCRDDSYDDYLFTAQMEAGPSRIGDPYIDGSVFRLDKRTSDGFGPDDRREYEKEQATIDQAALPSFIQEAKDLIRQKYSIHEHFKCLYDYQFGKIDSALWLELRKTGTTRVVKDISLMNEVLQSPVDSFSPNYFSHRFLSVEGIEANTSIQRLERYFASIK